MKVIKRLLTLVSIGCAAYLIVKKVLPSLDDAIGKLEENDPEFKEIMDLGREAQAKSKNETTNEITTDEIDKLFDDDDGDPEKTSSNESDEDDIERASIDDEDVIVPKELDQKKITAKKVVNFVKHTKESLKNQFSKHDEVAEYFSDER